jgi:RNA polymerase sigma-70 factor (ECF subfamily)
MDDVLRAEEVGALVERARACDPEAWEILYTRAYPRLLAYASRRLDHERARDAVSEAMVRAVAAIDRFTWQGGGFEAWLFGILRHVVLDAHRAEGRRNRPLPEPPQIGPPDPADLLLQGEESAAVRAAFERLSPFDQELLELRVVAGLSSEETARVLGKRPGAVRMAQVRALERLRISLGDTK